MNKIINIFILFCIPFISDAQGYILENLQSNQKVHHSYLQNEASFKKKAELLGFSNLDFNTQGYAEVNCPDTLVGGFYITSGDSLKFKIDTSLRRKILKDTSKLYYGTSTLNQGILTYYSNPGIDLAFDTLKVERSTPEGIKDLVTYYVTIKRNGTTETKPIQTVSTESVNSFCYSSKLPYGINCTKINVDEKKYGDGIIQDSCLIYKSTRFGDFNTVTIIVCNKFATCDTIIYNIKTKGDTLQLPFFDDFSYPGPYPDSKFWLDDNVYINNQMTQKQPSQGFATFDGIDGTGTPYSTSVTPGVTDILTSNFIDLSNLSKNDKVILSFYLQPKGLCYAANAGDSMVLEYKTVSGKWNSIKKVDGLPNNYSQDSVPKFVLYELPIDNSLFFYKGFQFRFKTYGRPNGIYEIWHLDYIRLDKNRTLNTGFPDIAFTENPKPILKNYYSMPWTQFKANIAGEVDNFFPINYYSHFHIKTPLNSSKATITENNNNLIMPVSPIISGVFGNITDTTHIYETSSIPVSELIASLTNLSNSDKKQVITTYTLVAANQNNAIQVLRNDTIRSKTELDNYYAYDDGTAEIQYTMQGNAVTTAVEYTANIGDTLKAIRIFFPHINGDGRNQLFNLRVWKDSLKTIPIYDLTLRKPIYTDDLFDTLQGFTTYQLYDKVTKKVGVFIPKGKFFVGYQNASGSTTKIPIGLDRNNQSGQHTFVNVTGTTWQSLEVIKGSLMIRPLLGSESPFTTSNKSIYQSSYIRVFPNPANNNICIELDDYTHKTIEIYNSLGVLVLQKNLEKNMDIQRLTSGIYFIKIKDFENSVNFESKFIKQ